MNAHYFESPVGFVGVTGGPEGVRAISLLDRQPPDLPDQNPSEPVQLALTQLQEYFTGTRQDFTFPLNPVGTVFQQRVWQSLREVPFGTTLSYLALSRRIGDVKAIRAVAAANGRNPLAIVVPCHRIIGSDGSLTGYAGGIWRKQWLLEHEGTWPVKAVPPLTSHQLSLF